MLTELSAREAEIERDLEGRFGAVICGRDLRHLLGYRSGDAFRHAVQRGHIKTPTFFIEGRRGRCATTREVARWMASLEHPSRSEAAVGNREGNLMT